MKTPARKSKRDAAPPAGKKSAKKKTAAGGKASSKKPSGKTPLKKAAAKKAAPAKATGKTVKKAVNAAKKAVRAVGKKVSGVVAGLKKKVAKKIAKKAAVKTTKAAKTAARPGAKPTARPTAAKAAKVSTQITVVKPAAAKTAAPRSKRPKAFAPADVARGYGFPAEAPELPELYGEDRLVLMTKDPEYLFAYWEVTPERQAAGEQAKRGDEEYREALRLNWAARDLFDANFLLVPIALDARKWYLRVPFSGIAYHVEIGWLGSQGHFISLLTSNPSDAPESWAATRRRLKDGAAGAVLERTLRAGRPQGSSDMAREVRSDKVAVPPGDWNFGGPGTGDSSSGLSGGSGRPPRDGKPGPVSGRPA